MAALGRSIGPEFHKTDVGSIGEHYLSIDKSPECEDRDGYGIWMDTN